ncbi:hypothetical protein ABIA32_006346 [Streptacidiphilus sp. MAP12-20]|uniref:streptophobe family protein n=1 Tax=Streptacidiphilus sp. MAP12-20 TaxID=3156299 RepID=UPI003515F3CC
MTVYQHGRPVDGPQGGGGPGSAGASLLRGVIFSAMAVGWAFGAMGAVGALGVHLLGLDKYANLGAMTAALVAMAVGGKVSPTGDVSVFGVDAAAAQGSIGIMPLGLTLVGAVVLGWLFTAQLRRIAVLTVADLVARAAGAVAAFLVLLAVVGWAGSGSVAVNVSSLTGGGSGGSGGSGSDPLGGLGGLIGGALGDNTKPTVGFKVDLGPTLGLGLLWVVLVLAFSFLAARRAPLPAAWRVLERTVRPVASAITTVYVGAVTVGALAGLVVGLTGNGGARTVGGALLGTPNGVFLAVPLGMGVSLDGKASGPLAHFLPSPINTFLAGGQGKTITVSSLASLDGRVWLLPVAVVLMLVAVGVVAAVRTPRRVTSESALQEIGGAAFRLGLALMVVTPVLLALADVDVNANLSVFGFDAVGAGLSVTGSLLPALVLGLIEGAVFGAIGAALVRAFAGAKRVPGSPATPPSTPPPGVYDALPPVPPTRPGPPPAHNPYAGPPAADPYGGLPQSPQPPPPAPRPQDPPGGNPYR